MRTALLLIYMLICLLGCSAGSCFDLGANDDQRLNRKVTVSESNIHLQDLAKKLTKMTDVTVIAGYTEADWRVKERKLHVQIKDLPLETVLAELSKLLDYHISRSGEKGKWTYRIWQDKRGRDKDAAELQSSRDAKERRLRATRKKVFSDVEAALAMSLDEAAKFKDTNPRLAYFGGTDIGRTWANVLRGLPQSLREAAIRGEKTAIDIADLSPSILDALNTLPNNSTIHKLTPKRVEVFLSAPSDLETGCAIGSVSVIGVPVAQDAEDKQLLPDFSRRMDGGIHGPHLRLYSDEDTLGRYFCRLQYDVISGEKKPDTDEDTIDEMFALREKEREKKIIASNAPKNPRLLVQIEPITINEDSEISQLEAIIEPLSKKTKLSYIVEWYPEEDIVIFPKDKQPAYGVLDSLQTIGYVWECVGDTVCIRPRDRALLRTYDIPESFLAKYRKLLVKKGCFDLNDLAAICTSLADGQIEHRLVMDEKLSAAVSVPLISSDNEMLRFYGSLNPRQKAQIQSDNGLSLAQLSKIQREKLASTLSDRSEISDIQQGTIWLTVSDQVPDKSDESEDGKHSEPKISTPPKAVEFRDAMFSVEMPTPVPHMQFQYETTISIPTKEWIDAAMKETADRTQSK